MMMELQHIDTGNMNKEHLSWIIRIDGMSSLQLRRLIGTDSTQLSLHSSVYLISVNVKEVYMSKKVTLILVKSGSKMKVYRTQMIEQEL